ncbi:MAG: alanine--glyoxylate aminotransferase family protein [Candidatus Atribacteria bacterium]|nr:alanine--glyoxylate aminotransferase family protein [Candidatus Atribacteria bacterium]
MKKKLMMIPGPTPVEQSILDALSKETVSHLDPELVKTLKETLQDLKTIVMTEQGQPFIIPGTGTLAMETALVNTLKKGDRLLVISHGFFGDRFVEIARAYDFEVEVLASQWGKIVEVEKITQKLKEKKFSVVTLTHVDTSTGVCAPLREVGEILKKFPEALFIVDGVCAMGGIEERMDDWGIDILFAANQKAIGVPPGLANLVFNQRALERRNSLGKISAYYMDINRWLPIMREPGERYFATHAVNMVNALHQGLKIILEEGLEERFRRHQKFALAFQTGLEELGFNLVVSPEIRANTVSTVLYPSGIEDISFRKKLYENGVLVSAGKEVLAGKIFRLGHMGNITENEVIMTLSIIEKTLSDFNYDFKMGAGVGAAEKILWNVKKGAWH